MKQVKKKIVYLDKPDSGIDEGNESNRKNENQQEKIKQRLKQVTPLPVFFFLFL